VSRRKSNRITTTLRSWQGWSGRPITILTVISAQLTILKLRSLKLQSRARILWIQIRNRTSSISSLESTCHERALRSSSSLFKHRLQAITLGLKRTLVSRTFPEVIGAKRCRYKRTSLGVLNLSLTQEQLRTPWSLNIKLKKRNLFFQIKLRKISLEEEIKTWKTMKKRQNLKLSIPS
jgi:hypothetical protein